MFGSARRTDVEARAKQIARMVMLIVHGLQTKSYEDFVERFSNPGKAPAQLERLNRQLCFEMRISPTCWYDAVADFARHADDYLFVNLRGGGDDFGVAIHASTASLVVELYLPPGQKAGRDAKAIARALAGTPGWTGAAGIEQGLDLLN